MAVDIPVNLPPFKIKVFRPIRFSTQEERENILRNVGYNLFNIEEEGEETIVVDLLTDSGTSAMTDRQWAAAMTADESYPGSKETAGFREFIRGLTGFRHVFPTPQGRAAESLLFSTVKTPGGIVPNNSHFDTTRANIEMNGMEACDIPIKEAWQSTNAHPFKGNMDLRVLRQLIEKVGPERIPLVMMTVTNNSVGGQPASLSNIHDVREIVEPYGIPLFLDACRFAENAAFNKARERGYADQSLYEIAQEMFRLADGCTMSAKKDGLANMGGFLALNDDALAKRIQMRETITIGFPRHGGLTARDHAMIIEGLSYVIHDPHYLPFRLATIARFAEMFRTRGIPIVEPPGGHAIYLNAGVMLPHIPSLHYPAHALAIALFREGGIRSVEVGSVMMGKKDHEGKELPAPMELVRLAVPRVGYTEEHLTYVADVAERVSHAGPSLRGFRIVTEEPHLRHFSARFEEIE